MRTIGTLFVAAVLSGCITIDTNEVAVKRNSVSGAVATQVYGQGFHHRILRSWTRYDLREIQHPREGAADIIDVLTSDQLRVEVDASFRYRIDAERARDIYLEIGNPGAINEFVFNAFRSAVRDAVAEFAAADILSQERAGVGGRIQQLMTPRIEPRGVIITEFFLRGITPPEAIRVAVEQKLARGQQVEAEGFQTQVVSEQANQRRAEAEGIRDAQNIIAASLIGEAGRAYLAYEGLQALKTAAMGENNVIIAPSEGGVPLMRPIPCKRVAATAVVIAWVLKSLWS